ncbi:MAG TPA: NYN domain-containing protein [Chloroflexota bacterium]|nr:NYN domain-containing protein [Chloroflexota bacterium]
MIAQGEVALFIDFENIRYSMLNNYGQEPDPHKLIAKARKYGTVPVAFAYADFSKHPDQYKRRFEAAGISRIDVPLRVLPGGKEKSSADLIMLLDIVDTVLDRPQIATFVLMTGDGDFVRISARLKNRFGKNVVISGIPGTISSDLVDSATLADPLEIEERRLGDVEARYIRLLGWIDEHWETTTFMNIARYIAGEKRPLGPVGLEDAKAVLNSLVRTDILRQEIVDLSDGTSTRAVRLNRDHTFVQKVLAEWQIQAAARAVNSTKMTVSNQDDGVVGLES